VQVIYNIWNQLKHTLWYPRFINSKLCDDKRQDSCAAQIYGIYINMVRPIHQKITWWLLCILWTKCVKGTHNGKAVSVCLSVCVHVSSLKLCNRFQWNLVKVTGQMHSDLDWSNVTIIYMKLKLLNVQNIGIWQKYIL